MKARDFLPFVLTVSTLVGCRTSGDAPTSPPSLGVASAVSGPSSPPAQSTQDAMDQRTPVPLLPMMANHQKQNMRDHLLVVQEIVAAVAAKDFDAVQSSVSRIGYSEQMGQMCEHMGAGAPGFTELALKFHHGADQIGEAAKKQDAEAVLKALSNTLATCTTCHQTYKQHVVDDAAWAALTKMATPSGSMHQ
jgi:hypothetical protein